MDICICANFPGASRVLRELSGLSGGKIQCNPTEVEDAETMFLAAWTPEYLEVIRRVCPKKVVVSWTSTVLQSGFEPVEFEYMKTILGLLDQGKIHALWVGSEDWLPYLAKAGRKVFYCPYPVSLPAWTPRERKWLQRDISLFGPLGPRKNVAVQAVAAKMMGAKVHYTDDTARALLVSIGVESVRHGWLGAEMYASLVGMMNIGLQCSLAGAESFSFVCWDHVSRDIPCLSTVPWLPDNLRVSATAAAIPQEIVRQITAVLYADKLGRWRSFAERFAESRNADVRAILEEELGLSLS